MSSPYETAVAACNIKGASFGFCSLCRLWSQDWRNPVKSYLAQKHSPNLAFFDKHALPLNRSHWPDLQMSNPLLFSEVASESGAQASHHITWGCVSSVKSSVSTAAGWCSPAALSKRCLSWDKVVRQPQKKNIYQMWRAGQCGGCVWTRLIIDTPVGRKDVKAEPNPTAIYGPELVWFLALKSPAEAYGFDHTYTASTFVLNLGGKVSFAAVMRHFSWPTSQPFSTSSAMAEPICVCMICCEFN